MSWFATLKCWIRPRYGDRNMANLARGFQRLAWVVSLVIGFALVGLGLLIAPENSYLFVGAGVGAFLFTWAVFFTCRWVVAGFRNDPARRRAADATSKADRKKCPRCGFEDSELVKYR